MERKINLEEFLKFPSYDRVVEKEITESNSVKKLISKKFYEKNDLVAKQIFEKNGEIYSSDSSASLTIFSKGKIKTEVFYLNGKIGRINRPAIVNYYVGDQISPQIKSEVFLLNGKVSDQKFFPAVTIYFNNSNRISKIIHVKDNLFHNDNGPAYLRFGFNRILKEKAFYKNGKKHNKNGPAEIIYTPGRKIMKIEYDIDGKVTRDNAPAIIELSCSSIRNGDCYLVYYVKDEKFHNLNGPAFFEINVKTKEKLNFEYYIDGEKLQDEFSFEVKKALYTLNEKVEMQ